jgi:hypothetical protein
MVMVGFGPLSVDLFVVLIAAVLAFPIKSRMWAMVAAASVAVAFAAFALTRPFLIINPTSRAMLGMLSASDADLYATWFGQSLLTILASLLIAHWIRIWREPKGETLKES